jgi:hypothetical protein
LNSWSSFLRFQSTGVIDVCHHAWLETFYTVFSTNLMWNWSSWEEFWEKGKRKELKRTRVCCSMKMAAILAWCLWIVRYSLTLGMPYWFEWMISEYFVHLDHLW